MLGPAGPAPGRHGGSSASRARPSGHRAAGAEPVGPGPAELDLKLPAHRDWQA